MRKSLLIRTLLASASVALAIYAGLISGPALGQAVDSVDIEHRGDATHIKIQFMTYIQYMRHAPADFGKSVRVYVQFTAGGAGLEPSDLLPRTKRFARQGDMPEITVSFPESDNSLLIAFDQPTKFQVRPSSDGRSIIVVLPSTAKK